MTYTDTSARIADAIAVRVNAANPYTARVRGWSNAYTETRYTMVEYADGWTLELASADHPRGDVFDTVAAIYTPNRENIACGTGRNSADAIAELVTVLDECIDCYTDELLERAAEIARSAAEAL